VSEDEGIFRKIVIKEHVRFYNTNYVSGKVSFFYFEEESQANERSLA